MVVMFISDDEGYLRWVNENLLGFVVNCYRNPSPSYLVLHRTACMTIKTTARRNWTTTGYIKVCSNDKKSLEQWAITQVGGRLTECQRCNPEIT